MRTTWSQRNQGAMPEGALDFSHQSYCRCQPAYALLDPGFTSFEYIESLAAYLLFVFACFCQGDFLVLTIVRRVWISLRVFGRLYLSWVSLGPLFLCGCHLFRGPSCSLRAALRRTARGAWWCRAACCGPARQWRRGHRRPLGVGGPVGFGRG